MYRNMIHYKYNSKGGIKMNPNKIFLVTEECTTNTQIMFICTKYFNSIGSSITFDNIQFQQESNNLYKISGIESDTHKEFYMVIARGSGSFVDVLLYDEPSSENLNAKSPKIACEITKNSLKESGNMTSQRLAKWATIQSDPLFEKTQRIYLIDHKTSITAKQVNKWNDRSFALMNLLGTEIYFKEVDSEIATKYIPKTTFNTLKDLSYKGSSNKVSITPNLVTLETNLYNNKTEKSGWNDPNTGWLSGIVAAIRTFDKSIPIEINSNRPTEEILGQNKLSSILFEAQAKMKYNNIAASAPKQTSEKAYWEPEVTGEKLGSISFELDLRNQGKEVIFSNHAGCEKSYVRNSNGHLQQSQKGKGIPDLVYLDQNKIYVVEAEQYINYESGLKQVKASEFRQWIKRELSSYTGYKVEVYVSTNKKNDTRLHVLYDGFGKYNTQTKPVYTINL